MFRSVAYSNRDGRLHLILAVVIVLERPSSLCVATLPRKLQHTHHQLLRQIATLFSELPAHTFAPCPPRPAQPKPRLWIRDTLVIDTSSTSSSDLIPLATLPDVTVASQNATTLMAGEVVVLRAEYIHHGDGGGAGRSARVVRVVVGWESPGVQPAQALPSSALYPSGEDVVGSPFEFVVD